jgi:hypothetical protein
VDAQIGSISIAGRSRAAGLFNAASGASLFYSGNNTFIAGTAFGGAGVNRMTGREQHVQWLRSRSTTSSLRQGRRWAARRKSTGRG